MGVIRLLLAAFVVVFHAHDPLLERFFVNGPLAVKLFFVISGFYMALILNEKYVGAGSLRLFYQNRLLRLLPLYYAMLLMALALALAGWMLRGVGFVGPSVANWLAYGRQFDLFPMTWLALSNLLVVGQEFSFFGAFFLPEGHFVLTDQIFGLDDRVAGVNFLLNVPAWTLSMELGFYALAPWVARRGVHAVILWVLGPLGLRLLLEHFFHGGAMRWDHFLPTQLYLFMLGVLAYRGLSVLRARVSADFLRQWGHVIWVGLLATLCTGALCPSTFREPVLVGLLTAGLPFVFMATAANGVDRFLGELSFPLYLSQYNVFASVQWIVQKFEPLRQGGLLRSLFFLTTGLVFSLLLYWCLDRPIDRFRQRRLRLAALTGPMS